MPNKEKLSMVEITKGYEKFIKEKEVSNNGRELFDKVIKKSVKPK